MKNIYLLIFPIFFFITSNAQEPVYYLNFDEKSFNEVLTPKDSAVYTVDIQQSQFTKGLTGKALNLSANAALRRPVKVDKGAFPEFNEKNSFSVQIWIKTLPGAKMGTPIMGNKIADDLSTVGWQIYTQDNGAWALILNDGKNRFDYKPTAERQSINDGKWHQILFTVNREKDEVWFYLDGKNVAIYNTSNMASLETELSTVVGGSDEKWEYGSNAQWNAFNGMIDEVKVWKEAINVEEVWKQYTNFETGAVQENLEYVPVHLKVLTWNIWHGGNRYGQAVGLERVIDIIKASNADVVSLVETYGSGEVIADSLGYYFYLISSNLSILSRYPITETIIAFRPFNFGGVDIKLGPNSHVAFFDVWLHYLPDYSESIISFNKSPNELIEEEGQTRHSEIKEILKQIKPFIENSDKRPIIMAGDFNLGSHLDWIEETKAIHYDREVEWPVSKEILQAGFVDSYREMHINPLLDPGFTWTPRAATTSDKYGLRDRIDFIYYKGNSLYPIESHVIDYHAIMFPSDHAALVTVFKL